MAKILKKLTCNLVNDNVFKDTIILTNAKTGKQFFFDTYLRLLKDEKIYGLVFVIKNKQYAVYSNEEAYQLMKKHKMTDCDVNVVSMEDLKALK